ncbi:MAG: two-component system response regulator [Firmicutes bacterium HGW-Firmicutes-1]|jgi:putative two-component system response regulator|nr:MAG: two-component system response regulator [Firmicutes bacterium HGW-Firmicutes-1]
MNGNNYNEVDSKILIVDDDEANISSFRRMLEMNDFTNIISTTDSREVVAFYLKEKPDLILLDLKMPYLDGFQVLEQLNLIKEDEYLPVIMITAENDRQTKMRALELGAREFISKPFDQAEAITRIKNLLQIKILHNSIIDQNHSLERKVEERTRELKDMQLEIIQRLLRAAEFRDDSTGFHISRIGYYARELGKLNGFSKSDCEKLLHASMMHDIGKVGIPDHILLKPGKLTKEEWEIMKQHTIKGAQILSGSKSEIMQLAEIIALTHHEKWDGTGYPSQLKGEEIPIESRITTLCDVFDALLSVRPYKHAWPFVEVVEEIKKNSGVFFDPQLTTLFLQNLSNFIEIKNKYLE